MKNLKLVILGLTGLALIGGYFLLRPKMETSVPRNPEGTVNEEVTSGNYNDYSKEEYDKAVVGGKVIMLYFTASWCPICREQEPLNMEVLDELGEDVIGLRIHILDSEETQETKALAEEYGVNYQHTYVILGTAGEVSSKYTGPLTKEEIKAKILAAKAG